MVNVPPPLLCSTPPPIDFGEDDDDSGLQSTLHLEDAEADADGDGDADEYSEYGLVSAAKGKRPHLVAVFVLLAKSASVPPLAVPALPELPDYNELSNGHSRNAAPAATVEAFNYQVKAPEQPPALEEQQEQQPEQEQEEEEEANTDTLPSLKLDSLSLYSSDSVSPTPCTMSPVADENQSEATKAPTLCHQVTLEDVSDDSDEECSPKKPKELFIPEGAADFFAIEIVATPTSMPSTLAMPAAASAFAAFQETPPLDSAAPLQQHQDEDDDFGDFADFSEAPAIAPEPAPAAAAVEPAPAATAEPAPAAAVEPAADDDGFDDFQDFVAPTEAAAAVADDDDDDDDFGDFSEPAFAIAPATAPAAAPAAVALPTPVLPQPPPPATPQLSITERVKPVLELMFPSEQACTAPPPPAKQSPLAELQSLHFDAIEQAHALDYQWACSEMRHALVRSLAIDSRNIVRAHTRALALILSSSNLATIIPQLFGDKWNSSMPPTTATAAAAEPPAAAAATTTQTSQIEAQPGATHGQGAAADGAGDGDGIGGNSGSGTDDDAAAAASVFAAAAATATLPAALPADGDGHGFDDDEQQPQQQQQPQQLELRGAATPSPPPAAAAATTTATTPALNNNSNSSGASFALPLKETHIYTPSKSDTAVAKTTTLAPIDFDYEIASAGIIIDETVVKKEYRDVEYKPPPFGKPTATEDDDFSDFQSVPAGSGVLKQQPQQQSLQQQQQQLQPPRNGTPTFGEQMILSPAILLPQTIPLAKPSIEWGDNALASINAEELARIEELFSHQSKPPTISATVAQKPPPPQQQQQQEDDEWSDFVSVPMPQQQQQQHNRNNNNNNVAAAAAAAVAIPAAAAPPKDDDWSDFVSSTPLPARAAPQFNSGAWQSANFYNNPLSLYQQQQQHAHSNVLPRSSNSSSAGSNNNNNNNSVPQQIHMMHDFSTAPTAAAAAATATYQQQHHQHHQQQLQQQQQQQRQQFQLGNAKVAPRISLIPDLSFVAPALPTNAGAFMSSLPKPSFGGKK
ncbi:hypothetical protein KR222_009051 [Zaprionus bogoriensis]|nr:hypothetical protein KR222_009051 [Zaprionus bogoriensis]